MKRGAHLLAPGPEGVEVRFVRETILLLDHSCTAAADSAVVLLELNVQWDLGRNLLINGLIQHTSKLNIFFFRKIHSNTF